MKLVHVVGRRNHGKTLLITALVREFAARGLAVATAKHCVHAHELDTPGKDSHKHRTAGASMTAVMTPAMTAIFRPICTGEDRYERLLEAAGDAALLLVEGHLDGPGIKVEVWRAKMGGTPFVAERDDISAIITDDPLTLTTPVWPRRDIAALADRFLSLPSHELARCDNFGAYGCLQRG
jgi:molybdopterin-guanine dinucleotide biosynthesis protein B